MLSISERTLFTLTKQGSIKPLRVGARVLYPRAELERFAGGGGPNDGRERVPGSERA